MTEHDVGTRGLGLLLCALLTASGCGNDSGATGPERSSVRSVGILPAVQADHPHVLFVNIGQSLADSDFKDALAYASRHVGVHVQGANLEKSPVADLTDNYADAKSRFDPHTVLTVFVESNESGYPFLAAPRLWAMVNLHAIDSDKPDPDIRRDRIRKQILKGLVYAAGGGVNPDRRCIMWHGSATLEGMDKTSVTLGPYVLFSLQETLRELGGIAVFGP